MFGIGYQELVLIMAVALVIFGPSKLPEMAGQVGRWVRDFRRMSADLTGEFEKTFAEVDEVRQSVRRELAGMKDEVEGVSKTVKRDLAKTTAKPATKSAAKPAVKAIGGATNVARNGIAKTAPLATKADPLSDVSLFDEQPVKPVRLGANGAPAANGASHEDAALARVRQRRAAAGYARRG